MALTQGSPLPDITSTATKTDVPPDYYTDYLTDLSGAATKAMARSPQQGIAAYDPLQSLGYETLPEATGAYRPGLSSAEQTLGRAAQGVTGQRVQDLMNPYTRGVVDEMERLQQQSLQRSILPTLKAGFVGSGGLGGQRYAGALGQAMGDAQRNLLGQQTQALQSGYSEALKTALGELPYLTQAGQQQAQAAKLAQDLGIQGAGALTKAGAERQAYEQSLLDYPLKTATSASALLRQYQIPTTQTTTEVGPGTSGQYQKSDLENIMGVLSLIGASQGGTTGPNGNALGTGANAAYNWAKDLFGKITSGQGFGSDFVSEIANTALPGQEGYGWSYYDNGTAISPTGEYYLNGELVWSPDYSDDYEG